MGREIKIAIDGYNTEKLVLVNSLPALTGLENLTVRLDVVERLKIIDKAVLELLK